MNPKKFLVVGATGHVGSKVAILLAEKGHDVTAAVRQAGASIKDPRARSIKYVTADLFDEQSMRKAVAGMDIVNSTANSIVPERSKANAAMRRHTALTASFVYGWQWLETSSRREVG